MLVFLGFLCPHNFCRNFTFYSSAEQFLGFFLRKVWQNFAAHLFLRRGRSRKNRKFRFRLLLNQTKKFLMSQFRTKCHQGFFPWNNVKPQSPKFKRFKRYFPNFKYSEQYLKALKAALKRSKDFYCVRETKARSEIFFWQPKFHQIFLFSCGSSCFWTKFVSNGSSLQCFWMTLFALF